MKANLPTVWEGLPVEIRKSSSSMLADFSRQKPVDTEVKVPDTLLGEDLDEK